MRGPKLKTHPHSQPPPEAAAPPSGLGSITAAWKDFISPPEKVEIKSTAVPPTDLADSAVVIPFRFPDSARPPPRLAAFALPSWVPEDLADRPRVSYFGLAAPP